MHMMGRFCILEGRGKILQARQVEIFSIRR
jgi:hypothetical protein